MSCKQVCCRKTRVVLLSATLTVLITGQLFVSVSAAIARSLAPQTSSLNVLAANDAAAVEVLEKHVAALGGRAAFDAIKTSEIITERQVLGRTIKNRRTDDIAGKRAYQRQEGGNGTIETGFDGQRAWQKAPFFRGYLDAKNPQAATVMRGGVRLPGTSLYDYRTSGKTFARPSDERLEGKTYLVIKSSTTDNAGNATQIKYYFDPTTFLLKQIVTGNAITQTESFDDYRQVAGIYVAFASTITSPQVTLTSKITELKINQPVDATMFEFREAATQAKTVDASHPMTAHGVKDVKSSVADAKNGIRVLNNANLAALSEDVRRAAFEQVWKTVNDTFYDRSFNGVDWRAVHEKYLPLINATSDTNEFHDLLNRMVGELKLSHFKVTAPKNVITLASDATRAAIGSTGITLRWLENQMIVAQVNADSPAARAGIRPGFVMRRIDGKTVDELYAIYKIKNPGFQLREPLARRRAAGEALTGKPNEKVKLELLNAQHQVVTLELVRQAQPASRQLEFEAKKIGEKTGYIRFNLFFGDLLSKFQNALEELKSTNNLIIDLRGNPGGAGDLAPAMANLLCASPGTLGSLKYRYETTAYTYQGSGERAYQGKILLLIDEGTGSTAEVFAGGLHASRRAVVVGDINSAGAVMPSLVALLPTGGALQYVVSNFQTANNVALEGRGVLPDIKVETTRRSLLDGRDGVLEQAIKAADK